MFFFIFGVKWYNRHGVNLLGHGWCSLLLYQVLRFYAFFIFWNIQFSRNNTKNKNRADGYGCNGRAISLSPVFVAVLQFCWPVLCRFAWLIYAALCFDLHGIPDLPLPKGSEVVCSMPLYHELMAFALFRQQLQNFSLGLLVLPVFWAYKLNFIIFSCSPCKMS